MNILVPLAGKDESFVEAFGDIKPFVKISGTPLIEFVMKCLPYALDRLIFICLREHEKRFDIVTRLKRIFGEHTRVVWAERLTEGSACSALLAAEYVDNDEELLVDLADIYFDPLSMRNDIVAKGPEVSGVIPICRDTVQDKPWGYVYFDKQGYVNELKEKEVNPVGRDATLGLYHFARGADFVRYTRQMINENRKVSYSSLFYTGPVYNLLIEDGKKVITCDTKIKSVLGSVEEVKRFINKAQNI
jgi:NDP-sugar pyrophosphorylase family protein